MKMSSVAERQRRQLSTQFKAKVRLAALREDKALAQLCEDYQVQGNKLPEGSEWTG